MAAYQQTVEYRTYIKQTVVEALRAVFSDHPDPLLKKTKVTVEMPTDEASYPAIVVRYYNRWIRNAGIGHYEWMLATPEGYEPKLYQKFKHFLYAGDVELKILALSSKDRDFLADAIVQTVGMADAETYTRAFLERVYNSDPEIEPGSQYHFINLKTDDFQELGDQETPAIWMEEDLLVYSATFRIPIFGEFYSRLLTDQTSYGTVEAVDLYPWIPDVDEEPDHDPDNPWLSSGDVIID
jgi:hypothetical protein